MGIKPHAVTAPTIELVKKTFEAKGLNPPEDKQAEFNTKFGLSWPDALAQDKVFNALDACTKMGLSGDQMDVAWGKAKKAGNLVKFGGGFYAGHVNPADAA